ncbi:substrate-binding periplasmic protein [Desulfonema magnum]|uniref:Solute-binding protein family 3 domain-containing protein, MltF-like n=1 Tax=Desulfonema magnum TaxID=45655 RepID=A0A975BZ00_9BACT|nr:transporter substrate-binding domain-containing protein [Desulfonema magnum]QTA93965.1 Solute-binding protein family 3 domain-containing protein, MltF-like [Desulfonema magnum]
MKTLISALIIITLWLSSADVLAEKLVFAIGDFPPYQYMEDGQVKGMDVDIIRNICDQLAIETEFRSESWIKILKELKKGKADGIPSLLRNKEREKFLCYCSECVNTVKIVVLKQKGSSIKVAGLNDLKNIPFGMIRGHSYGPEFDNCRELKRQYYNDNKELAILLHNGRIKLAVVEEKPFLFTSRTLGIHDCSERAYTISDKPLYIGFSKKSLGEKGKALAEKFSEILREMKKKGEIQKIINNYVQ